MTAQHHDLLVVGAGSSGCVLAARLALATELHIGLVEAGPDYGPFLSGRWPEELRDPRRFPVSHDWGFREERPGGRTLPEPRARVLGGCSAHNQCAAVWGTPADYDAWAAAGLHGWSQADLEPLFAELEDTVQPRQYENAELATWQRAFVEAAQATGFRTDQEPSRTDRPFVVGSFAATVRNGVRWHAGFAFLDAARGRPNLQVRDRLLADRLLIDSGRATGLLCRSDGETIELTADRFVLSAGVYGSPAILLRSGIGPSHELREIGIEPVLNLTAVGRNLHDHPGIGVGFQPTDAGRQELEGDLASARLYQSQVIAKAAVDRNAGLVDLHLLPYQAPTAPDQWRFEILAFAMRPRSRGSVQLTSDDPDAPPRIDLGFLSDRDGADRRMLMRGLALAREIAEAGPMRRLVDADVAPGGRHAEDDDLERFVSESVGGYGHAVGTCRMGAGSDPEAVVDGSGRVHGTSNVYVADASIIPEIPGANTNLTCYVIGRRIADALAEATTW